MSLQDRWLGNLPSVGAIGRLDLENHLLSGARVVLSNGLEMDAFQQGTEERKKTTSQGTSLAVTVVVAGRNTPCLREIIRHGRVFAPRVNETRSDYPMISSYLLLRPNEDWVGYLNEERAPVGGHFIWKSGSRLHRINSVEYGPLRRRAFGIFNTCGWSGYRCIHG